MSRAPTPTAHRTAPLALAAVAALAAAVLLGAPAARAQMPCPDGRPPCADVCCDGASDCRFGQCFEPGGACALQDDCPQADFCDPVLAACLTRDALPPCEYRPPVGQFDPVVQWGWHGSPILPDYRFVMMTPAVVSLTDDNGDGRVDQDDVPDVVFTTYVSGGSHAEEGVLRAVSGDDGRELFTAADPADRVNGLSSLAVGDLDGDGSVDIVTSAFAGRSVFASGLQAFERDGRVKWKSDAAYVIGWGGPALADLEGDGTVEVVAGRVVLHGATGRLKCQAEGPGGQGDHDGRRPLSVPVDLDGDGLQEIVTGNAVYESDCRTRWVQAGEPDGFPAVADLNLDGTPEIVVVYSGGVRIQDITGRVLARNVGVPGATDPGGAPTIADFDGDGRPEMAMAGSTQYVVMKPTADLSGLEVLWSVATQDASSRVTGSSVFDFDGDGSAEVVYNDECYVRVMRGRDGAILFQTENSSGTTYEYPLIVDVDGDGAAEIIAIGNGAGGQCPWAGQPFEPGIRVFEDRRGNWVGTRRIWNQHAYSVTNVCDGIGEECNVGDNRYGAIPRRPRANWSLPWLNNFRQNVQGEGVFAAPDLVVVSAAAELQGCPYSAVVTATVFNQGSEAVPAGVTVALLGPDGATVATAQTVAALPPGGSEVVLLAWPEVVGAVRGAALMLTVTVDAAAAFNECREENNGLAVSVDVPADGEPLSQTPCATGLLGACALGRLVCLPEGEACVPDAEPAPEDCNSRDDDCDGEVDEGLRNVCGRCGPDPVEVCDGLDQDCDGVADDDAPCPPEQICRFARCLAPCVNNECQGDDLCFEGFCVEPCDLADCDAEHTCEDGVCRDPCAAVVCAAGEVCRRGACGPDQCSFTGCPEGQICAADVCVPDPCAGVTCGPELFCRGGVCVQSCAAVACAGDQTCVDGVCVDDPCALVDCPDGQICTDGACHLDPCAGIDCGPGGVCLDGLCSADPCTGLSCPPGETCRLDDDGRAQCVAAWAPDGGAVGFDGGPGEGDAGLRDQGAGPGPGPEGRDAAGERADAALATGGDDAGAGAADPSADAISSGCACESAGRSANGASVTLLALVGLLARRRRRGARPISARAPGDRPAGRRVRRGPRRRRGRRAVPAGDHSRRRHRDGRRSR